MKGFVATPPAVVDLMVDRLFEGRIPSPESRLLDPGCGDGAFLQGVIRWCTRNGRGLPSMVGIELELGRAAAARASLSRHSEVQIYTADFLSEIGEKYDFVIGNPPYVPITGLDEDEKRAFRLRYETARGRFDLYLLFFEQGIKSLKPGGRLVFITPEKFLYVETARPLRRMLSGLQIEEIRLINETAFGSLITYPTITTIVNRTVTGPAFFVLRDGRQIRCTLKGVGESWMPHIRGAREQDREDLTLGDICDRVSCGPASGADSVFVHKVEKLDADLLLFAYPTIAGRELVAPGDLPKTRYRMLIPYDREGRLISEHKLGALRNYLSKPEVRRQLLVRTCVRRKPWYAFHETPLLAEILKPKILCKDIGPAPCFWVDRNGTLVPRHSVYYIVPRDVSLLDPLAAYLNSGAALDWLMANCQRAANGFVRLQSSVLKRLPLPSHFRDAVARKGQSQQVLPIEPALAASPTQADR